MPEVRSSRSWLSTAAVVLALAPVVLLPQVMGGVDPRFAVPAALCTVAALALVVVRTRGSGVRVPFVAAPLVVGLSATLLQLAPLPAAVQSALSPAATETRAFVLAALPEDARAEALPVLSLDPPETAFAAVRLAGALALLVVVAHAARSRRKRALVYHAVLAAGALLFVVSVGHALLRVDGPWGVFVGHGHILKAPLVNPNHLVRCFGVLSFICVARALVVRRRGERWAFMAVGVACGAGLFLALSRGAMLAFGVAAALFGWLLWREAASGAGDEPAQRARAAGAAAAFALVLAVTGWLAYEPVIAQLGSLGDERFESSKAALYLPALSLLTDYGWTGAGNSAFGVAYASVAHTGTLDHQSTFTHVENIVVATLVDHGLLVGSALLLIGLVVALRLGGALRDRASFAPLPAIAFLVIGDLFDFVLEHAAGLFLLATLLGLAAAALEEPGRRVATSTAALVTAALVVVIAAAGTHATAHWRRTIDARIAKLSGAERAAALQAAIAAHPFDAHYCYLLAVEARRAFDPAEALRWANRAMVLWPSLPGPHVEAARALVVGGRLEQAMLEYREAWRAGTDVVGELLARTTDMDLLRNAVPQDSTAALARLCRGLLRAGRLDDAQRCADDLSVRDDADEEHVRMPLEIALLRSDVAGARERLALVVQPGIDGASAVAALRAIELVEGIDVARERSGAWVTSARDVAPILQWQLDAAIRAGAVDEARALLPQLRKMAANASAVDRLDRLEVRLLRRQGDIGQARAVLARIVDRSPNDARLLAELALLELELDHPVQARLLYERAARIAPDDGSVRALRARLDAAR